MPSRWVQVFEETTPSIGAVAASTGGVSRTFREVAPTQREVVSTVVQSTTASSAQPCSGCGRRRRSCRGQEVVEGDPGFGRDEPARTAFGRSIKGGPVRTTVPSSPGEDPVLQPSSNVPGSGWARAEAVIARAIDLRPGGARRREPSADLDVRRGFSPCACLCSPDVKVAEADRRVEEGKRLLESGTDTDSQGDSGVWCADGPPSVQEIPPMPTDHKSGKWISERNCDLRNALEFADSATFAKVGSLLRQGTAQLASGSRDVPMDGLTRSAPMASRSQTQKGGWRCQQCVGVAIHGG